MKKILITIFKIAVFFIGWAVLSGIIDIPSNNPAIWRLFAEFIPLAVLILFTVAFLLIEKNNIKIPIKDNLKSGVLIGTITGLLWIGIAAAILMFSKQLFVIEKNDISFLYLWVVSAFINVIMQELLIRGYISAFKSKIQSSSSRYFYDYIIHFPAWRCLRGGSCSCHKCYDDVSVYHGAV